jgi:hypothetical protein
VDELPDVDATVQRIESLLDEFALAGDPRARERAGELVGLLMKLYGAGLARVVELAGAYPAALEGLAGDKVIASLLLLHGLHPDGVETRIERALKLVERRLDAQYVRFDGIVDGVARIRIEKNGGSSPWPPEALAMMVERAVMESAPDIDGVAIEGLESTAALVQIAPVRGV